MSAARDDVKSRIEAVEAGYEFFLAYAAQGLTSDQGSKSSAQLRGFLTGMRDALDGLVDAIRSSLDGASSGGDEWSDFLDVLDRDARSALAAVRLVAAQEGISSQLIDDLNANIHVRAVLAELWIVDELIP